MYEIIHIIYNSIIEIISILTIIFGQLLIKFVFMIAVYQLYYNEIVLYIIARNC